MDWLIPAMLEIIFCTAILAAVYLYLYLQEKETCITYIWTGRAFMLNSDVRGLSSTLTGWAFVLWGIHKFNYTVLRYIPSAAPWGYIMASVFEEKLHHSRSRKSGIIKAMLEMLDARDYYTQGHAQRLKEFMAQLARAMGMSKQKIDDLTLFAAFHDIGKVGIRDSILFKKGRFTMEEMKEMQRHSEIGHRIALSSPETAHIADWILMHHEWWDGSGYPFGISGEEIPLECRMLAIVDAYDAMTSDRPYRPAMTHKQAAAELKRCAGAQFDPYIMEIFLSLTLTDS
jgi:HD-GYP domain-containing protein (c-di-GMP phosphodiesterase class II)